MSDPETKPPSKDAAAEKQAREQSTIQFTYGDIDDAVEVAAALMKCGGVPCDPDQLAAAMGQTQSSGSFRGKIAAARQFGVLTTFSGKYQATELGFAIVDPGRQRAAKADAFLAVPLFRKVYEEFRGKQLPPRPLALERALVGFGVAAKQADRARQALDRSAQQAGFFDQGGRDRLIRPPNAGSLSGNGTAPEAPAVEDAPDTPPAPKGGGGGGSNSGGYHPFVLGLLDTLPASGTLWTIEGRAAWLEAAASAFKLIYKGDGKITIAVTGDQNQNGSRQN